MKISRSKKLQKILTFFATNFAYREPYQVLVDATFCQSALQNKVIVGEQLKKFFQSPVKLLTTQCIILEAESLGPQLNGATQIVKQFYVHKCGHEGAPIAAAACIKSMTKDKTRYIVASQDRTLQDSLRKVPGRCLLYLHKVTPVLEPPSAASKKYVLKKLNETQMSVKMEQRIEHLKREQGLLPVTTDDKRAKKTKGQKNPNPLSCKKSKRKSLQKSPQSNKLDKGRQLSVQSTTPMKAKRKRTKIPAHVKDAIKSSTS